MKTTILLIAVCGAAAAQEGPAVLLDMMIENRVSYSVDSADVSKLASNPNSTPPVGIFSSGTTLRTFATWYTIADIVSINRRPVKGTWTARGTAVNLNPSAQPGEAIADTTHANQFDAIFEILQPDGTPIGTLFTLSAGLGPPPPGAPLLVANTNAAILGGTGAFLGMRGQYGLVQLIQPEYYASVTEDPANRRINGAGAGIRRLMFHLIPMERPVITNVFHADLTPVNAASPAKAGETLVLMATGLGPTRPGVDPGQPFPADKVLVVNSPMEATVNGQATDVVNSFGWPGLRNTYRIDIRVPAGIAPGAANVQLTVAWIGGPAVQIPVR